MDGRVLIHVTIDTKEDVNALSDAPGVGERVHDALRGWFEEMRQKPHSFYTPTLAICPQTTNVVWPHAPERMHGNVRSAALASDGWGLPDDGTEYQILVMEAGRYGVMLHTAASPEERGQVVLSVGNKELRAAVASAGDTNLGAMRFAEGKDALRLDLVASEADGDLVGLTALAFGLW